MLLFRCHAWARSLSQTSPLHSPQRDNNLAFQKMIMMYGFILQSKCFLTQCQKRFDSCCFLTNVFYFKIRVGIGKTGIWRRKIWNILYPFTIETMKMHGKKFWSGRLCIPSKYLSWVCLLIFNYYRECNSPKLVSFRGRASDYSPRARIRSWMG